MTYTELEYKVIDALKGIYDEKEARSIQRFLFNCLTGMDTAQYLLNRQEQASAGFENKILQSIPQLVDCVPVQYVTGKTWFCGLEVEVASGVLIPRPETEELVYKIIETHKGSAGKCILDIGTGSGAIAVALSSLMLAADVYALDVSKEAIEIARKNSEAYFQKVKFLEINILQNPQLVDWPLFDIIVSNPPYVKESERIYMQPNVLQHEPGLALFVPDKDPLVFYRAIAEFAHSHLRSGGELWLEFNESEADNLRKILESDGFDNVIIYKDIHNKARFLKCNR